MYESEENSVDHSAESRDKLEDIRHKSDEAQERKALERRERTITEERQQQSSKKLFVPIIMAIMLAVGLAWIYSVIDSVDFERRNLMLDSDAFRDATERVMQNPNILKVSFQQELASVRQIGVTLYIDYTVVDERAKKMGSEVMAMLMTPADEASIEDDRVGSGRYSYRVTMSRLDDRKVAMGIMAVGSPRVNWK
ncbi:MAG TPA: hypothetical protein ENH92_04205 [Ectothiorhodospiraceae bacterium]|nr:hypothetical protein [Ectothiorhodospiraceae bacterium]